MLHQIMNRPCRELRFTRKTKVCNFLTIKIRSKPWRDCIGLSDTIKILIRWSRSIYLAVVVQVLMILKIVMAHFYLRQESLNELISN